MLKDKSFLAIIPARGGSKGVPKKNIKLLNGKPLIYYTIEASLKSKYVDRVIVTSDSKDIIDISRSFGADAPFVRPASLSNDIATSSDVVLHTVKYLKEEENKEYDYVVLLQPTSPFRNSTHINEAIEKLMNDNDADSLVSLCESKHNPHWMRRINQNGYIENLIENETAISRRQDLPKTYLLNGAIYICKTNVFCEYKKFLLTSTLGFVMDQYSSIDIDTEYDFALAEYLIAAKK